MQSQDVIGDSYSATRDAEPRLEVGIRMGSLEAKLFAGSEEPSTQCESGTH